MTVIVFTRSDGVMAADTAGFQGDFIVTRSARKIIRTPRGELVGCAGLVSDCQRFTAWAMRGFPENDAPSDLEKPNNEHGGFGAIVAYPDGRVVRFEHDLNPEAAEDEVVVSEGAGQDFVFALATLGWSAGRIVAHMIEHCVWADGEVYSLRLEPINKVA